MSTFITEDLVAASGGSAFIRSATVEGFAIDCSKGERTDIWDGADGTTSTKIWVAPTDARIHDIESDDSDDNGGGPGLRVLLAIGLRSWDEKETSEVVIMDGTTPVPTANPYVVINRMTGLAFGTQGSNAGTIKATAQTDGTVTAAIRVGMGATLSAIYGIPSIESLMVKQFRSSILKEGKPGDDTGVLFSVANQSPHAPEGGFVTFSADHVTDKFRFDGEILVPRRLFGPAIVKLQVNPTEDKTHCSASFSGYVVTN